RAPVSFLSAGFTFDLGVQFIIKNLSLTIAYFTDFTAGVSSYDYSNLDLNALNMNVSIGMDFRISYYKFKKL
ncbi:MAG TPA: hypothetical protein PLO89_12115, partial [Spirochaetota bacterium]|nr:hypothetical protein [Spirochaetota bacterium]